jgi:predicted SAM-dependent methyltransferase
MALRIELGGGESPREGYFNMDARYGDDATVEWPFEDNSVEEIYSCEFLEHVEDTEFILQEAIRVLKPGGKFEVRCPDFEGIVKNIFTATPKEFEYMKRGILGDGSHEFDFHKTILWYEKLKKLMEDSGFTDIKRLPVGKECDHLLEEYSDTFINSVKICCAGVKPNENVRLYAANADNGGAGSVG